MPTQVLPHAGGAERRKRGRPRDKSPIQVLEDGCIASSEGFIFSPEDEDLARYRWTPDKGYPRNRKMAAHREVLSRMLGRPLTSKEFCDHQDGDSRNNRRSNLRLTDALGNAQNRDCGPFRGTKWNRKNQNWNARVSVGNKQLHIGCFSTREEAAAAAAAKRAELGFLERGGSTQ